MQYSHVNCNSYIQDSNLIKDGQYQYPSNKLLYRYTDAVNLLGNMSHTFE